MKLGIMVPGRRPEDIAVRLRQARDDGFGLCQLNLHQSGLTRADLVAIAGECEEIGVRPLTLGCYVNPLQPDTPTFLGGNRADLDLLLQNLDIIGARRIVIWSGTYGNRPFDQAMGNQSAEARDALINFLTDVVRTTRARHYYLCIELNHAHVLFSESLVSAFHDSLPEVVREHVRYVIDPVSVISPPRFTAIDHIQKQVVEPLANLAGAVHLRDIAAHSEGVPEITAPTFGQLNYPDFVHDIEANIGADIPVIIRNVPHDQLETVRTRILSMSDNWQLN